MTAWAAAGLRSLAPLITNRKTSRFFLGAAAPAAWKPWGMRLSPNPGRAPAQVLSWRGIAQLLFRERAHQAGIDEVRGHITDQGKFAVGGEHDAHVMLAAEFDKALSLKLSCRTSTAWRMARPATFLGNSFRKASKSSGSNFLVAMNCQLTGPSLSFSSVTPLAKNLSIEFARLRQHPAVGGKARTFQGENKILGRFVMPFAEAFRLLRTVIGAVDLDAGEVGAGIFQLPFLGEAFGIKVIAPVHRPSHQCRHRS